MSAVLDISSLTSGMASSAASITSFISSGVGGAVIAIILITLLVSRELLDTTSLRSRKILATLDAVAIPVLIVFVATLVLQILELVYPLR
jgi:hypothetical protein